MVFVVCSSPVKERESDVCNNPFSAQFESAEEAYEDVQTLGTECPEHLHTWLTLEIVVQSAVGSSLFIQSRETPTEPDHLKLWRSIATALRTDRIVRFGVEVGMISVVA